MAGKNFVAVLVLYLYYDVLYIPTSARMHKFKFITIFGTQGNMKRVLSANSYHAKCRLQLAVGTDEVNSDVYALKRLSSVIQKTNS